MNIKFRWQIILLVSIIVLYSCNSAINENKKKDITNDLDPYLEAYISTLKALGLNNEDQALFTAKKALLFDEYRIRKIKNENDFEQVTNLFTKNYLDSVNYILENWEGKITIIEEGLKDKQFQIDLPHIPFPDNINSGYSAGIFESSKTKKPIDKELLDKFENLQKVTFTAKVLDFNEHGDFTSKGQEYRKYEVQSTSFYVEFINIETKQ